MTVHEQNRAKQAAAGPGDIRAKFMLVLLCLLWGINWTVMKIALQDIPPLSMRTISSAFGAGCLRLRGKPPQLAHCKRLKIGATCLSSAYSISASSAFSVRMPKSRPLRLA